MDPVSITLGVIPLVGAAIKSYRSAYSNVKIIRHYSTHIQRGQRKLKYQRRIFENECNLLLRFAFDPSGDDEAVITEMTSDPSHAKWNDATLEKRFRDQLGENCEPVLDIVCDINTAVSKFETELARFDIVGVPQATEECRKGKRVKHGLKAMFNKTKYDGALGDLRTANDELRVLREQIERLHRQGHRIQTSTTRSPDCRRGNCLRIAKTQRVSKALHQALVDAWSCGQASHLNHLVKLFVAEPSCLGNEIRLNLAIICPGNYSESEEQASLLRLQVWSHTLEVPKMLSPPSDASDVRPRKRLKSVRFATEVSSMPATPSDALCNSHDALVASCDLRHSRDICSELAQRASFSIRLTPESPTPEPLALKSQCLGHIDSQSDGTIRHSFYTPEDRIQTVGDQSQLQTLDSILDSSVTASEPLDIVGRLELARSVASAVLKFHSTPWMQELWSLGDFSLFRQGHGQGHSDLSMSLRTLHVGSVLRNGLEHTKTTSQVYMQDLQMASGDVQHQQVTEDERLFCGIGSLPLHSLGVALLQIDRWARLEPGDVLTVRKMAGHRGGSLLGPRYQEIVKRCLACDFGVGDDLESLELQDAVHEKVIGVLEKMIASLDLSKD